MMRSLGLTAAEAGAALTTAKPGARDVYPAGLSARQGEFYGYCMRQSPTVSPEILRPACMSEALKLGLPRAASRKLAGPLVAAGVFSVGLFVVLLTRKH